MPEKKLDTKHVWHDANDAPELTAELLDAAEIRDGGKVIRPARGKLGPDGVVWFQDSREADEAA